MTDLSPDSFMVRILDHDGRPVGVGALVSERHIVTCAHIVNIALGLDARAQGQPVDVVTVDFPLVHSENAKSSPSQAAVVRWLPPPREGATGDDIAGLELLSQRAPAGTAVAQLAVDSPRIGRAVRVFGYPGTPPRPDGVWVSTMVRGRVGGSRLQLDSGPDSALRVQPGFSGSPVFDDAIGRVVGLLASAPAGRDLERDSYAIGADQLRFAWPEILDTRWQPRLSSGQDRGKAELTILHVSDMQFGRHHLFGGNGLTPSDRAEDTLFRRLHDDLSGLADDHGLRPDLLVVTGDLAEWGLRSEFEQVVDFLSALSEAAEIPRRHVAIVPGNHDVNRKACEAYFAEQESDEAETVPPYFPKWRQFVSAFTEFYADVDTVTFTPDEPWTLFEMPDLDVVVAGLNSTMAESHRDADHYGWVGEHQLRWFADRLEGYREQGWLRVAAVHHNVVRGAVADEENLRDADDLDRLIGAPGLANLLLHGHTHDAKLHWLPSGLAVLSTGSAAVGTAARPAEVPNQYQLITVRRDGFTRYARQYAAGQHRWIGDTRVSPTGSDWRDHRTQELTYVDTVFPPQPRNTAEEETEGAWTQSSEDGKHAGARKSGHERRRVGRKERTHVGKDGGTETPDPQGSWSADGIPHDPYEEFLERVAEATRVRFPDAMVTERPEAGYLRVSHPLPAGGTEQWPVGVIDGPVTETALESFVTKVHAVFASADPSVPSELVYGGPAASGQLVAWARQHGIRLRSFIEYQGLVDLRPLVDRQSERLATDRIYPAWLYVPQRYRMVGGGGGGDVRTGLIEQAITWLSVDDARLVIVLGDFGRGKTSFLRQLTRTVPAELPDVLPILVELRSLEKAPALDELLAQYLVRQGVEDINPAKLRYMINSGRTALLFDGFDELELRVGYENATDYLRVLLDSVTGRAKVVLTSRTQHFRSTEQVRTALGERVEALTASRVVVLEDFSEEQVLQFLANLYGGDDARAQTRFDLLGDIANLLDLAHNPRMLAFVAALDEDRLRAVQSKEGRITAAGLYKEIIEFWLGSEAARQRHRRGLSSIDESERLAACTALALRLWASKNLTIGLNDLSAEVSATLTGLAERGYSGDQATHSIGSGSLLVRTDDGAFTFVHQSIMEWLVAAAAAADLEDPRTIQILTSRQMSRLMADFFIDLVDHHDARHWATQILADAGASQAAKQNALAISDRLSTAAGQDPDENLPERQNLAGVDLRGQDLTSHDLSRADLTGANLRGMRLQETDLSGADLRDADLTGARMIGGSLRGAKLTGSQWDRAALLGTDGLDEIVDSPEQLRPAAVAGRDPAEVMIQPPKDASCVAFSPDGTLLAIGSGNAIQVVEAADGRTIRILQGHTGSVRSVVFSPDGTLLASTAADRTTRIWDLATCTIRRTLKGHTDYVRATAFSSDCTLLATASYDNTVRIWDLATGVSRTGRRHTSPVQSVVFSADGTLLAATSDGRAIQIWDPAAGTIRTTMEGHTGYIQDAAFSPDGTLLATTAADRTTRIWDVAAGTARTILQSRNSPAQSAMFSAGGTLLAAATADGAIRIWDLITGATHISLEGHTGTMRDAAFSPDGTLLATTAADGSVRIWDLATGAARTLLRGNTNWAQSIAFSPDGALLATASDDGVGRIWDLVTCTARTTHAILDGHTNWVQTVAFSPDGILLATASDGRTTRIWDLTAETTNTTLEGHTGNMPNAAFSPDGTMLATASYDNTVRIWDLATGTSSTILEGHTGSVRDVAFSLDGTLLATASADDTARIWDLANGTSSAILEGHTSWVQGVAFSSDGALLATVSDDKDARIWELTGLRADRGVRHQAPLLAILHGHTGGVRAAAFSPDGAQLATASDDGTIRIWGLTTYTTRITLQGHTGSVRHIAFSPDGTLLASAAYDNTIRIWDVINGVSLVTLVSLFRGDYATLLADGYKLGGDPGNDLWWAIKLCRFAPGELDPYVPSLQRLPADTPILDLARGNATGNK